jgi:alginate O-acetyltransferase complex protein AlgI
VPFSSLLFIHLFLPVFLLAYWVTPRPAKNYTAIAFSLVFYAWGAPRFLPVVVGLAVVDYGLGHAIARAREHADRRRRAKLLLAGGITVHLSVLAYFKYSNFFVAQINDVAGFLGMGSLSWTAVVLPIGISFITFEEISYLVDVYRGDARPARRLSRYLLFLTLFPHSIAGPIFRWKDLETQLGERSHGWVLVREGFERFALGLAKKVLVADSVGIIADGIFALPDSELTTRLAWLGATAYAIQIYFDFSGYSDMAIGLGKLLGFRFKENFDRPYISASITEFWTRWHISLSSWMRDYLYVPLGGNRRGARRTIINVLVVFLLSGLWHGPAWTFVIWGAYHGSLVAGERLLGPRRERMPLVVQHALTLFLLLVGWVFFRAGSLDHAAYFIAAMFGVGGDAALSVFPAALMPQFAIAALVFGVVATLVPIYGKYGGAILRSLRERWTGLQLAARLGYVALFALSAIHMTNMRFTPLIYFKF